MSTTLKDRRGRTKRRGNFRPHAGKTFRVLPLSHPTDEWATHYAELNGKAMRDPFGQLIEGSAQYLREMLYRSGADEAGTEATA